MTLSYINKILNISFDIPYEEIQEGDYCLIYDSSVSASPTYKAKATPFLNSETRYTEENPSADPSDIIYIPYTFYWYTFSAEIKIEESGTYNYEAVFYDAYNNEGDTEDLGSIEICLVPEKPDTINYDNINFTDISSCALYFDGTRWIDTNTTYQNIYTHSFTLNMWVKIASDTFTSHAIFGSGTDDNGFESIINADNGDGTATIYVLYWSESDNVSVAATVDKGGVFSAFKFGEWNMITVIAEQITIYNVRIKLFVNGVNIGTSEETLCGMSQFNTNKNFYFGAINAATVEQPITGSLFNCQIIDDVLTDNEIINLYNYGELEYYTFYHYHQNNPSDITEDISYPIDNSNFNIPVPTENGIYSYYRTATGINGECETTSEESDILSVIVDSGIVYQLPYSDVSNLNALPTTGGKIQVLFKYPFSYTGDTMPETFNVYYSQDPSGDYILDGSINFEVSTSKFGQFIYTTTNSFIHNSEVYIKVLPAIEIGSTEYIKNSDTYVTTIADATGPTVTISNIKFETE